MTLDVIIDKMCLNFTEIDTEKKKSGEYSQITA